jgi:hypothetical protein
MSDNLRMDSVTNLSLNHTMSNMPFDESIEFRNSDYISSETMEMSDEPNELEECVHLEREDIDVYDKVFDKLPPIPPTKDESALPINIMETLTGDGDRFCPRKIDKFKDKIGNGKMEYIKNPNTREMYTNAWSAITFSNNWDFVSQDIESFMWSNDPRIDTISKKMIEFGYNGHSGTSFGSTMRNMQYLVQNGEDEFKKLFDENDEKGLTKFLDYSGGF